MPKNNQPGTKIDTAVSPQTDPGQGAAGEQASDAETGAAQPQGTAANALAPEKPLPREDMPLPYISGTVYGPPDTQLNGVPVTIEYWTGGDDEPTTTKTHSGNEGDPDGGGYKFTNIPTGSLVRMHIPPTHAVGKQHLVLNNLDEFTWFQLDNVLENFDIIFDVSSQGPRISGVVKYEANIHGEWRRLPLQGVQVQLLDNQRKPVNEVTTDAQGNFTLPAPAPNTPDKYPVIYTVAFEPQHQHPLNSTMLTLSSPEFTWKVGGDNPLPVPQHFVYKSAGTEIVGQVLEADGNGLESVTVQLINADGVSKETKTSKDGSYRFPNVPPGSAELRFPDLVRDAQGKGWELSEGDSGKQQRSVGASGILTADTVTYQPEAHWIEYTLTDEQSGAPRQNVLVELRDQSGGLVDARISGPDGLVRFSDLTPGMYKIRIHISPDTRIPPIEEEHYVNPPLRITRAISPAMPSLQQLAQAPQGVAGAQSGLVPPAPSAGNGNGHAVGQSMTDLQAYPVLTESVGYPMSAPASAPTTPAGGTGAPLAQIVDSALRDVLSWRPKAGDAKGFVNALNQAFTLQDIEGHTVWQWTPKSYTVQTDLGAVTGAQASIYTRAKVALDQSLPLLNGLYTLSPNVLPEDLESIRGVVADLFTKLVGEFGLEGGPRVPRVNELFQLLLGSSPVTDPENLPSTCILAALGDRFGMTRKLVNTVDDEQDLTNFLILVDYINGLYQSWHNQMPYFLPNPTTVEPFLGTQLVLLSQAFEVIAQAVQDLYFAMDSVYLGQAERQTILLTLTPLPTGNPTTQTGNPTTQMFAGDLFDWAYSVASDEGPRVVQSAGKDGIVAFTPILNDLQTYVRQALINTAPGGMQDRSTLPPAYSTPRVQLALQQLADQLAGAYSLALPIKPAQLDDVDASMPEIVSAVMATLKQQRAAKRP